MRFVKDVFFGLRNLVYPMDCAVCGNSLLDTGEYRHGICVPCMLALDMDWSERCPACGRPLISERGLCMECREKPRPSFDAALALYPYSGRYRNLLGSYKFGSNRSVAEFLAERLVQARRDYGGAFLNAMAWVPVPPKRGKIRHKGWDQVDCIAGRLRRIENSVHPDAARGPRATPIPVVRCLERDASRSQKELDRNQRAVNLRGKIRCIAQPPKNALLFDDVITTGATLEACAMELKENGAETVCAIALFYD